MAQGGYTVKDLYQGGTSNFSPTYGENFTGYQVPAGKLGLSQNPSTANQLAELDKNLKQGVKSTEVGALDPSVFETIPKDHFKEIRRTAKLAGAKPTMHAPVQGMEPSGIDPQQGGWSEMQRRLIEDKLKDVARKAHEMDEKGNMPITIHSANVPGTEWEKDEHGKVIKGKATAIDQKTGQITKLQRERKYIPGKGPKVKEDEWTVEEKIENQNETSWSDSIDELIFNKDRADQILKNNYTQIQHIINEIQEKQLTEDQLSESQKRALNMFETARTYLDDTEKKLQNLFDEAYRYREPDPEKAKIKKQKLDEINRKYYEEKKESDPLKRSEVLQSLMVQLKQPLEIEKKGKKDVETLAPRRFERMEDFAKYQSAKTFGNVALENYSQFGDKAPVVSIENIDQSRFAFASGKDMNELIEESKKHFVDQATKSKKEGGLGLNKNQAKKKADKLIGLTFDVGHLNISKTGGLTDEDLKKEFQAMSKHLKHVHLTDNFGYHDSHLSPGMGNVPFKQYYEEMKKKGFNPKEIDQIVEAGGVINQFGMSPHPYNVENFGSPIYESDQMPYWNQAQGLQQGYMSGYGDVLPQGHFQQFGGGFSQLPAELGGSAGGGGGGSRVSGNPME